MLESLQNYIYERLRESPELCLADIKKEDANGSENANGLSIAVGRPLPENVAIYANHWPAFLAVRLRVEVSRFEPIDANAPSLLSAAEIVSKSLHGWNPPRSCGYGRISLPRLNPWILNTNKITIIFYTQGLLQ